MKKSKSFKKVLRDRRYINKQRYKPDIDKIMGNAKESCYTCIFAGYIFDDKNLCYVPYCHKFGHPGRIANISYSKWNDSQDERERRWERYFKNGNIHWQN